GPSGESGEPRGGAAAPWVEERSLAPDAGEHLLLAVLAIRAGDRAADAPDRTAVPRAELLEGRLIARGDRLQQLGVARLRRRRARAVRWRSERLSSHRPTIHPGYACIFLPVAMFGCPFGLTISQRPPCMSSC